MKKNLLSVLILALLIVNIVLTVVMMVSVIGTNNKTAELVRNIVTILDLELTVPGEEKKEPVSLEKTEYYTLPEAMTIALKPEPDPNGEGEAKQKYLMFNISFSLNTKHKDYKKYSAEKLVDYEMAIKDVVTSVVSAHTSSECADIDMLKAEILEGVQELFDSDVIYNVAMSDIKFG